VTGEYKYDPHQEKSYPNLHGVEWSRSRFSRSTNRLAAQNSRRSINWIFRDEPIPVGLLFS
jgi:hypothetical protein